MKTMLKMGRRVETAALATLGVAAAAAVMASPAFAGADGTFDTALNAFTGFLEGSGGKIITVLSLAGGVVGLASGRFSLGQVAIPVGQGAIRAAFSQADDIKTPVGDIDNGAKQYNIGYDYRFSKRTTVGVGYAKIDNDAGANFTWSGLSSANTGNAVTPPAGSDVEIFFVSMIHRF